MTSDPGTTVGLGVTSGSGVTGGLATATAGLTVGDTPRGGLAETLLEVPSA